jgi:dihydrofolate reductase
MSAFAWLLWKRSVSILAMCKQHLPHREEHTVRNIIVSMRVTLDGFIAGLQGEMDWMEEFFDEALATYESELQKTVDTTIFVRVTYQGFESYWPKVALDSSSPLGLAAYAHQLNAMRKLVFSQTLSRTEWNNSVLVHEIVPEEITKMKQEPGRDMVIYGSTSIVRALTNLGLIDRYQLLVYPMLLGSGKPLFQDILHTVKLSLVSTKTHPSGVVELSYQPIHE